MCMYVCVCMLLLLMCLLFCNDVLVTLNSDTYYIITQELSSAVALITGAASLNNYPSESQVSLQWACCTLHDKFKLFGLVIQNSDEVQDIYPLSSSFENVFA